MTRDRTSLPALLRIVCARFDEDRCMQIASSLTFTTLLAIVPVVTIILTMVSAFPVFSKLVANMQHFVVANLVPSSVDAVSIYAGRFAKNAASLTAAGIFFLGITGLLLLFTIEAAFNDIWRVTWQRRLLRRILISWGALLLGPIMIGGSLSLTSYLISLSVNLIQHTADVHILLLKAVPPLLTAAALSLLYFGVPNRAVAPRDALIGGVVAGLLFEAMKLGFGFYVTHFPSDKMVYGAFAVVPIFLLWIYLSWLIVLGGAVLVAELPEWREHATSTRHAPGSDFFHALRVLEILWRAQRTGRAVSTATLHTGARLRIDRLEWVLSTLVGAGWVVREGASGWALAGNAGALPVREVYRLFVLDFDAPANGLRAMAGFESRLGALAAPGGAGMDLALAEFFDGAAAAR